MLHFYFYPDQSQAMIKKPMFKRCFIIKKLRHSLSPLVSTTAIGMLLMTLSSAAFANADMHVNTLISQAIQSHPLVGAARAEQRATTESIRAAKLNMLPAPTLSSGYDRDDGMVSQLRLRQSLWTGGKLTANVNQAVFDDKAATEYVYEQQNQVAKTTIEAWQSYMTAVAKQQVYYDNLQLLTEFEAMMHAPRRPADGSGWLD